LRQLLDRLFIHGLYRTAITAQLPTPRRLRFFKAVSVNVRD
jgi:hypothetical protein